MAQTAGGAGRSVPGPRARRPGRRAAAHVRLPLLLLGGNMFAGIHQENLFVRLGRRRTRRAAGLARRAPVRAHARPAHARVRLRAAGDARRPAALEDGSPGRSPTPTRCRPRSRSPAPQPRRSAPGRRQRRGAGAFRRPPVVLSYSARAAPAALGRAHLPLLLTSQAMGTQPAEVADHVDELGVAGHDDLAVLVERPLDGFELAQHLGVAHEVLVGGLVDELDGLRLALGLEDLGLVDALGLLDLGAARRRRPGSRSRWRSRWPRSSRSRP